MTEKKKPTFGGESRDAKEDKTRRTGTPQPLTDEEEALQSAIEHCIETLQTDKTSESAKKNIDCLWKKLRESQDRESSVSSYSKALRFLRNKYGELTTICQDLCARDTDPTALKDLCELLSLVSSLMSAEAAKAALPEKNNAGKGVLYYYNLAVTYGEKVKTKTDLNAFGFEYVRLLLADVVTEYETSGEKNLAVVQQIVPMQISQKSEYEALDFLCEIDLIPMFQEHCLDKYTALRAVRYIIGLIPYALTTDENDKLVTLACCLLVKFGSIVDAWRCALRHSNAVKFLAGQEPEETMSPFVGNLSFISPGVPEILLKQFLVLLGRQCRSETAWNGLWDLHACPTRNALYQLHLHSNYKHVIEELELVKYKTHKEIFKVSPDDRRAKISGELQRIQLCEVIAEAFVNCGYGQNNEAGETQKLSTFLRGRHEYGFAGAAAVGLLYWGDFESGLNILDSIDGVQQSTPMEPMQEELKGGALMGVGLVGAAGVRDEYDAPWWLLKEHLANHQKTTGTTEWSLFGALLGLGIAYAGRERHDILDVITPFIIDGSVSIEASVYAALAAGLIFVGSSKPEICECILQAVVDRAEAKVSGMASHPLFYLYGVAIGILSIGTKEASQCLIQTLDVFCATPDVEMTTTEPENKDSSAERGNQSAMGTTITSQNSNQKKPDNEGERENQNAPPNTTPGSKGQTKDSQSIGGQSKTSTKHADAKVEAANNFFGFTKCIIEACAFAGSGDLTRIQGFVEKIMQNSSGTADRDDKNSSSAWGPLAASTIGIGLVALGENIGQTMCLRLMERLLLSSDPRLKQCIPLLAGLIGVSTATPFLIDTLSRLSHDPDTTTACNAIFALGLTGAGTNNAKIASFLQQLASYYYKNLAPLLCVRISQALLHAGKGLLCFSPVHSDKYLMAPVPLSGLIIAISSMIQPKKTILGKYPYLLYFLGLAAYPRWIVTVDEELKPVTVPIRVGTATDPAALAGEHRSITGFLTLTSPALLSSSDKAELATEDFAPAISTLENFVIVTPCDAE